MALQTVYEENEEESYSKLEFTGRNNKPHNSVSTEGAREECEHSEQEKLTSGSGTLRDTNTATANNDSHGEKNESSKEREDTDETNSGHDYCQLKDCGQGNAQESESPSSIAETTVTLRYSSYNRVHYQRTSMNVYIYDS